MLCYARDAFKKVINTFIGISNIRLNDLLNLQESMDPESDVLIYELSMETLNDKVKMDTNWIFINSKLLAMRFMKEMMQVTRLYHES